MTRLAMADAIRAADILKFAVLPTFTGNGGSGRAFVSFVSGLRRELTRCGSFLTGSGTVRNLESHAPAGPRAKRRISAEVDHR